MAARRPVNPLYGEILAEDNVGEMCRKICAADVDVRGLVYDIFIISCPHGFRQEKEENLFHKNANFFERLQHSAKFFRQCPSFLPIVYKKW